MPCACGSPGTQKEKKRKRERKKEYKKKRKKGKKWKREKRKIHFRNFTSRIFFSLKLIRYRGIELILVLPVSKVRIQTRIHQTCSLSAKFTRIERRLHFVAFNESHKNSHTTRYATFPFYTRSANGLDTHCHFRLAFSRKAAILRYPFVAAAAKRSTREGTVLSTDSVSFVRPNRLLLLTNASFHTQNSKGTHTHTHIHIDTHHTHIHDI